MFVTPQLFYRAEEFLENLCILEECLKKIILEEFNPFKDIYAPIPLSLSGVFVFRQIQELVNIFLLFPTTFMINNPNLLANTQKEKAK